MQAGWGVVASWDLQREKRRPVGVAGYLNKGAPLPSVAPLAGAPHMLSLLHACVHCLWLLCALSVASLLGAF